MKREDHLRAIYIVGSAKRGRHDGVRLMCSGPECHGAEMFAGLTVAAVVAAADAHLREDTEQCGSGD